MENDVYAAANKAHFDKIAQQYDDIPRALERARRSAAVIRKAYPFDEDTTTVMEYACGTGLVSRELAPFTKSIVGVDISQGMVDQFNKRVHNQGIPPDEMRAICAELKGEQGELEGAKFDVIVCAAAYHHFTSINDVTRILATFLKQGGALLVVDLLKTDVEHTHTMFPEGTHHFVAHKGGLRESDMQSAFEGAGLMHFAFDHAITVERDSGDATLFLAKGIKP